LIENDTSLEAIVTVMADGYFDATGRWFDNSFQDASTTISGKLAAPSVKKVGMRTFDRRELVAPRDRQSEQWFELP